MATKYDKVEVTFIEEDTEDASKLRLRLYLRREKDRQWFQASARLSKDYIVKIDSLTPYQKQKYMSKKE